MVDKCRRLDYNIFEIGKNRNFQMAIVKMISRDASPKEMEGAYCPLYWNESKDWEKQVILKTTHHGLCLFESERNMYDDSDFFMTVWNPEKGEPETIMFATTRGWSYPCLGSSVDATPEVAEAYNTWKKAYDRRRKILAKLAERKKIRGYAQTWGVSVKETKKLLNSISKDDVEPFHRLLKTETFRSNFRKSLNSRVRDWMKEENSQFSTPLSRKQMMYL
jgi:hypothetical protein